MVNANSLPRSMHLTSYNTDIPRSILAPRSGPTRGFSDDAAKKPWLAGPSLRMPPELEMMSKLGPLDLLQAMAAW